MLGRGPLGAPPTLLNFDAQNRAIWPISIQGYAGSDMLDGGRRDRGPCRLRPGPK